MKKYLEVRSYDGVVVKRMDVSGKTEKHIDLADSGLNRNINHEKYFTVVNESEEELELI